MEKSFPTLALIVLIIGFLWLLSNLHIISIGAIWLPIILIIVSLGWIINHFFIAQ